MEPKFTQGPWVVRKWEGDEWPEKRISISSEDQGAIAISPRYATEDQMMANAHLIAAAPDMHEALESVLECGSVNDQWWVEKIKTALAKARREVDDGLDK